MYVMKEKNNGLPVLCVIRTLDFGSSSFYSKCENTGFLHVSCLV